MGKKTKKNRFNKTLDVDVLYSCNTITNINMVGGDGGSRGFCFVDFATRDDLAKALSQSDSSLAGRSVIVRIAAPNNNDRGGWSRDRTTGPRRSDMPFERRRGSYRPAGLRDDDLADLSAGGGGDLGWKRGAVVNRNSGFSSKPMSDRPSHSLPFGGSNFPPRAAGSDEPAGERPRINVLPRTNTGQISSNPVRNPKIFGGALPVDTASRDLHLMDRLSQPVPKDTHIIN